MQSEESNTLVKLAKAVIEHAPEGGDAFWGIKFSDIEAALSAADPVAELQSIDARELDEAIQLLPSVMRPSLSKVIIAAIEEQRRIIAYFKRISRARQLAFEAATTPPAPSVAVNALEWKGPTPETNGCHVAETIFGTYSAVNEDGWYVALDDHPWGQGFEWSAPDMRMTFDDAAKAAQADYEARIRSTLSAQVQDVAASNTSLLREALEAIVSGGNKPELSIHDQQRNRYSKWAVDIARSALPAAPAKQEAGHVTSK